MIQSDGNGKVQNLRKYEEHAKSVLSCSPMWTTWHELSVKLEFRKILKALARMCSGVLTHGKHLLNDYNTAKATLHSLLS
jgi:hypothetical protein